MVEFAKKSKIHNYDQSSGHGYYQFTRSEFISDDNKILLMNKVSVCYNVRSSCAGQHNYKFSLE